jgi:hypothetical protein
MYLKNRYITNVLNEKTICKSGNNQRYTPIQTDISEKIYKNFQSPCFFFVDQEGCGADNPFRVESPRAKIAQMGVGKEVG